MARYRHMGHHARHLEQPQDSNEEEDRAQRQGQRPRGLSLRLAVRDQVLCCL